MTTREEFEAWAKEHRVAINDFHYRIWQAARAAALEEAAKESAQVANIFLERNADAFAAAAVCCERVRALKD